MKVPKSLNNFYIFSFVWKDNRFRFIIFLFLCHDVFADATHSFLLIKFVDNILKNHYIISCKTSISKDKNTCKKWVRNQQGIS